MEKAVGKVVCSGRGVWENPEVVPDPPAAWEGGSKRKAYITC